MNSMWLGSIIRCSLFVWLCNYVSDYGLELEDKLILTFVLIFITEVMEHSIPNKMFSLCLAITFLVCLIILSVIALQGVIIPWPELGIFLLISSLLTFISCILGFKRW